MRRRLAVLAGVLLALGAAPAAHAQVYTDGKVKATVGASAIELSNGRVSRRWTRVPFRTQSLMDFRDGGRKWSTQSADFSLTLNGTSVDSKSFTLDSVSVTKLARGGLRVSMRLVAPVQLPGVTVDACGGGLSRRGGLSHADA